MCIRADRDKPQGMKFLGLLIPLWFLVNAPALAGGVVVIGDSLAAGLGATDQAYTPSGCLEAHLGRPVVAMAKAGLTSEEILNDAAVIAERKPELVFVSSGGNDVMKEIWSPGSYPKERSQQEMERIFSLLTAAGSEVIYLGIDPPFLKQRDDRLQRIWELALQKRVTVVDGMNGFWGREEWMSKDGIHPNNEGYRIMCERIVKSLKPSSLPALAPNPEATSQAIRKIPERHSALL